ncbi:CDP-glycerol glycerophosphotransferase family protein [Microlunatus speluncae]|uniref:CDP-glycerol glycerophosphotransferase family protein n=1 Tax=Microlunatus speluncae TaxID=2594267 RepID=UPI001266325B|nr:CDP-glycerol glycerophosphotransferase family protein [Microlunatus speluncae]
MGHDLRAAATRLMAVLRRRSETPDVTPLPVISTWNLPGAPATTPTEPRAGRAARIRLGKALRALRPRFAIAYAGHNGAQYQCRMWEPYLAASGEPYLIVTDDARAADLIRRISTAPLILLAEPRRSDLELVLPRTVRAAFYVQNSKRNRPFLKLKQITHVWLNHGDSDKPANFRKTHADYDRIVTCGEAGVERYAAHGIVIARDRFDILGRPQISDIVDGPRPGGMPPTVLYAPTWRGISPRNDYTSVPLAPQLIAALLERELTVIFRGHPFSAKRSEDQRSIAEAHRLLADDRERSGRQHVWGAAAERERSLADCVNLADAMIADVTGAVTDFLASGRPYAMMAMSEPDIESFRVAFPISRSAYVIERSLANLDLVLDDLLITDPLADYRAERRRYYLGPLTGQESAVAVADYVRRLARGRLPVG